MGREEGLHTCVYWYLGILYIHIYKRRHQGNLMFAVPTDNCLGSVPDLKGEKAPYVAVVTEDDVATVFRDFSDAVFFFFSF